MTELKRPLALIIQHVLPKFQKDGDDNCVFDPKEYIPAILSWIESTQPNVVIMTTERSTDDVYPKLNEIATNVVEWCWEHDDLASDEEMAVRLGVSSENLVSHYIGGHEFFSKLYPWMHDLREHDVILMGGFVGECVKALDEGLEQLGIDSTPLSEYLYPRRC